MSASRAALALFLKNPEPGTVKTRLTGVLGPERAARFYWECALLVMAKALRLRDTDVFVWFTPAETQAAVEALVMARFGSFEGKFIAQVGTDLGERMHQALDHLHGRGYARTLVLGTDSPTLPLDYLQRAVDTLNQMDCVIGPTWDGGYYLFGTKQPDPRAFHGVTWSSGMELAQTYENVTALGHTCLMLPRWQDIDTPDDLPFLKGQVRHADYRRLKSILDEVDSPS